MSVDDLKAVQAIFGLKPEDVPDQFGVQGLAYNTFEMMKSLIVTNPMHYAAKVDEVISFFERRVTSHAATTYV
ncbi:hypothetical protein [Endozoicomonas montiporae]|nr:hypothetical protein [Endozoicomonas montiporae]